MNWHHRSGSIPALSFPKGVLVVLIWGLLTLACRFSEGPIARADPPSPPPGPTGISSLPPPIATAVVQSATAGTAPCQVPAQETTPPDLVGVRAVAPPLLAYLNAGGSPERLTETLVASGHLSAGERGSVLADLTGDGLADLALSVLEAESGAPYPPGVLLVFACDDQRYQLAYTSPEFVDSSAPAIHSSADLNGDGVADLLTGSTRCGAHTCTERLEALIWNGRTLVNRLRGASDDLPSPSVEVRGTAAGAHDIAVTATGIGSVGAGPFRMFTRTWQWSEAEDAFLPTGDVLHPSRFRIHVLHDADNMAGAGNHEGALALYQSVIMDDSLDDWVASTEGRANLAAYARFRRSVSILLLGDQASAEGELEALKAAHPAGTVGSAFSSLGESFWIEYQLAQAQGDQAPLGRACAAAQAFAASHRAEILDALYYGYANPSYGAADVCPFPGSD